METDHAIDMLVEALRKLPEQDPVTRAKAARALTDTAKNVLSAVGDEAVIEVVADGTYAEAATKLGVSAPAINKAVTRHRARRNSQVRPT